MNGATLFVRGSSGIYRSTDQGQTWAPFNLGEFSSSQLVINSPIIFAGNSAGLWRSTDQGKSWTQVRKYSPSIFPGSELISFVVSGVNVFVVGRAYSTPSARTSIFTFSPDLGQTWIDIDLVSNAPSPSGQSINSVQVTGEKVIALRSDIKFLIATDLILPTVTTASAASYRPTSVASESIVVAFGAGMSASTQPATTIPLPTALADTTINVKDSAGVERLAPLFYVSPTQINYQVPPFMAEGLAILTVRSKNANVGAGIITVGPVAPGLFTANMDGQGAAAAVALQIKADGSRSYVPIARFDTTQNKFVTNPIDLGEATDQVYVVMFGTGLQNRTSLDRVSLKIGATDAQVVYAGRQGEFVGLDQLNALIPRSLMGKGEIDVELTVDGLVGNLVRMNIK